MADEAASQIRIEELDIENMKVAELKKKLKDIGLPITGNKSELVERLQGSILAAHNNAALDAASNPGDHAALDAASNPGDNAASNPGVLESSNSEVDSALLNDSNKLNSSSIDLEDKDSAKTCGDELPVASPEKIKEAAVATNALKPLKKRFVAQTTDGSSEKKPKEKKKIVLNRNHVPTPKFIPNKPAEPLKNKNVVTYEKSDFNKCKDIKEEIASARPIQEGSNKIYLKVAKNISDKEKITMRAKRFNIITAPEPISKSGKIVITSKKDRASSVTSTLSSTLTSAKEDELLTPRQKRALRFGVDVTQVIRELDKAQMKSRKRKIEIGKGTISAEEQEKKKKRAERFGIV